MTLKQWVSAEWGRGKKLAEALKVDASYVSHLIRKPGRHPSRTMAARIEKATGGEVTRYELLWPEEENDVEETV